MKASGEAVSETAQLGEFPQTGVLGSVRYLRSLRLAGPWPAKVWMLLMLLAGAAGRFLQSSAMQPSTDVLRRPTWVHPMGTDELGRDVLERVIVGATNSILVAGLAVALGLMVGASLGVVAIIAPRWIDTVVMRLMDVLLAFPIIVLGLLFSLVLGSTAWAVALLIGTALVPHFARLVRGRLASELQNGYLMAERATGASLMHQISRHAAPNILPPLTGYGLLVFADAMLIEAALSFIGVGLQPPAPSWGNMILGGQRFLVSGDWWVSVFPGLVLFLTVSSLNTITDDLSDGDAYVRST